MKENSNLKGVIEHMAAQTEELTRENRALVLQLLQNSTAANLPNLGQASAFAGTNMGGSNLESGNGGSASSLSSQIDVSNRTTLGQNPAGAGLVPGASMGNSFQNSGSQGLAASLSANRNSAASHPTLDGQGSAGAGLFAGTSVGDLFQNMESAGLTASLSANQNNLASQPTLGGYTSAGASFQTTGNQRLTASHSANQNNCVASHPSLGWASVGTGLSTGSSAGAGDSVRNIGGNGLPASLPNQNSNGAQLSLGLLNLLVSQNPSLASQLLQAGNVGLCGIGTSNTISADPSAHGSNGLYRIDEDTKRSGDDRSDSKNKVKNSDEGFS